MLLLTINLIFAAICFLFARQALRKAVEYLRFGWLAVGSQANKPDAHTDVFHRRLVSEGGLFLLSGAMWLAGGIVAGVFAVRFALQAIPF